MEKTESQSPGSEPLNWLEGDEGPECQVLTRPWEGEEGCAFRLGAKLNNTSSPETGRHELPSGVYLPVPDRVLDVLEELSGCEVRLCLLMIRAAYAWNEDVGEFRATSRRFTASEIKEEAGGYGMSKESLREAANKLGKRGWIEQSKSEGEATVYRWALSVPRSRYTLVPAPLAHAHQALSHSGVTLLLSVIRATIGWASAEGDEITYKRSAELCASDLEGMTGLSRPTIRSAAEELVAKSAIYRRRKHAGAPWEWAVDFSFFRAHLQKICTPTTRVENGHNTRGRQTGNAPTKGGSRGRGSAYRVKDDWERAAIEVLTAPPFEVRPGRARDLVIRRAKSVVEGALGLFRRRRSDIKHPAGWICAAIESLWFGPAVANKSPTVRQSDAEEPIARAFEALTEKREGWEWGEGSGPGSQGEGLETEPRAGVSHSAMCDLIDALRQPPYDWETIEQEGQALFVPSKELANWAYRQYQQCRKEGQDQGGEAFEEAARQVVHIRARHEGRKSPINGE